MLVIIIIFVSFSWTWPMAMYGELLLPDRSAWSQPVAGALLRVHTHQLQPTLTTTHIGTTGNGTQHHQQINTFSCRIVRCTVPKVIDFPRYNMKCSGENVILRGIFHVVSRFPLLFMLYRGNLDCFSNNVCSMAFLLHVFPFLRLIAAERSRIA